MIDEQAHVVENFELSVSIDGMHILITFGGSNAKAGLAIPHEKAMQLMGLISKAAGEAAGRRNSTANTKFLLPVTRWEFKHIAEAQVVILSYKLPNEMEISFQVPRQVSAHMRDGLTLLLDKGAQVPSPETLLN